jgi:energy-converting hydrogenase Eha subunit E
MQRAGSWPHIINSAVRDQGYMSEKVPQLIIMLSGAALIVVGVILVILQLNHELALSSFNPSSRALQTSPTGGLQLATTYVGLIVLAIGATLEIVGFVAASPWRSSRSARISN